MASADQTITQPLASIESDSDQRTVTITPPATGQVLPPGMPGRQYLLTNIGEEDARIGVVASVLNTNAQADGQCDLKAGESMLLERGCPGFVHESAAGTTLRLSSVTG